MHSIYVFEVYFLLAMHELREKKDMTITKRSPGSQKEMGHEADNARQCKALALSCERRREERMEKDEKTVLTNKR